MAGKVWRYECFAYGAHERIGRGRCPPEKMCAEMQLKYEVIQEALKKMVGPFQYVETARKTAAGGKMNVRRRVKHSK